MHTLVVYHSDLSICTFDRKGAMEMQIVAVVIQIWDMVWEHFVFQSHSVGSLPVFPVVHKEDLFVVYIQ